METPAGMIESVLEKAEAYGKTTYELSKLKSLEAATVIVNAMVARLSVIIMLCLFVLVFNIGIAIWLGDVLGRLYYGFFIVAALYLVAGVVLHFFLHKWIKRPVEDFIITQVLQ